jgi:hypothetical protein
MFERMPIDGEVVEVNGREYIVRTPSHNLILGDPDWPATRPAHRYSINLVAEPPEDEADQRAWLAMRHAELERHLRAALEEGAVLEMDWNPLTLIEPS